jgi:hypothetical protein
MVLLYYKNSIDSTRLDLLPMRFYFLLAILSQGETSATAAKAKQALISSEVSSEKSSNISASVIPPAKYSKMSDTVIRSPRIYGLPLRFPGSIVMISW